MTDEKSCKNCAYYHACCPYQFLDICDSKSLKYFEPKDQGGEGEHAMINIGELKDFCERVEREINIGELKDFCERVEREYGSDAKVILQIY